MPTLVGNRVLDMIEKRRRQLGSGLKPDGTPITADIVEFEQSMAIDLMEFVAFQNIKSRAQLRGILTLDEAMTVYAALGEGWGSNGGWAASTDLATKVVITQLMGELLAQRV